MGKQNGKSFKPEGVVSPIGFDDGLFCVSQSKQRPINVDDSVDLIDDRLHVANHGASGDELIARLKATGDDAALSRASANAICDDLHIWYKVTNAVYGSGFGNLPKREELRRDDASVKKELINKKYDFNFIMSHPMAGIEKTGFQAGNKDLFKDAKWLIGKNNSLLRKIIKEMGAKPYCTANGRNCGFFWCAVG